MARVEISEKLKKEILKKFKKESNKIFQLLYSLKENPKKGKIIGSAGGTIIKELKYKNYRFYFITDNYLIRILELEKLQELIIRFVRMSDKKSQQKVINEIKYILRKLGEEGF